MKLWRKLGRTPGKLKNLLLVPQQIDSRFAALHHRIDELRLEQGRMQAKANRIAKYPSLQDYEFRVFSQFGEDGIIQHLVNSVDIASKTFIEFGVEDFVESNCRFLMSVDGWSGLVMDGSADNVRRIEASNFYWRHDLVAICSFITRENISATIRDSGFGPDIGILSIDIDGVDYHIWEELDWLRPAIIITEYNSVFGCERAITVPYEADFQHSRKHYSSLYFGASLAALHHLARLRGYSLVGSNSHGVNAFFVRDDLMPPGLRSLTPSEAYIPSKHRESRRPDGSLSYVRGESRLELIRGLPVINVLTGAIEDL